MAFPRAFKVALKTAVRNPNRFPKPEGELRRTLMRRFPFALSFRVRGEEFLVAAVFHHRRDPRVLIEPEQQSRGNRTPDG